MHFSAGIINVEEKGKEEEWPTWENSYCNSRKKKKKSVVGTTTR